MDCKFGAIYFLFLISAISVSSSKPFLDLQFDLKLSKSPKECRKSDENGRCFISYAISLLESHGDFDLQAIMLQEGNVAPISSERKKHFREDTLVAIPAIYRVNQDSQLFVGIKFYGLGHNSQDYFILDASKIHRHSSSSKTIAAFDTDDLSFIAILKRGKTSRDLRARTCACLGENCGCCAHVEVQKIGLNHTTCMNVTYLPHDYGISFTFSLDGRIVYNGTISARNPPPVCFGVPYLKEYASLCLKFYNLDIGEKTLSGCVKLEAELYHVRVAERELGCFHVGQQANNRRNISGEE